MAEVARGTLPPDAAERWLSLLRPAAGLRPAESGELVAGTLGGLPMLPYSVEWPHWPQWNHPGPLSFIASLDCAAVSRRPLDITLPDAGSLLFFYFDGQCGGPGAGVDPGDPASDPGSRVIYVPPGEPVSARACPEGIRPYGAVDVAAVPIVTWPHPGEPALVAAARNAGMEEDDFLDYGTFGERFSQAMDARYKHRPVHWVGGYAEPNHGPAQSPVAESKTGLSLDRASYGIHAALEGASEAYAEVQAAVKAEAENWTLLLRVQPECEPGMNWDGPGCLYWLTRKGELADGDPARTAFTCEHRY